MIRTALSRCKKRTYISFGKPRFAVQTTPKCLYRTFTWTSTQQNVRMEATKDAPMPMLDTVGEGISKPLASKSTWKERVQAARIAGDKFTLADLYSLARRPEGSNNPSAARLTPLPLRVKGHPTPCLSKSEIESALIPLCERSAWTVDFLLSAEEAQGRTVDTDCGCAPRGEPSQNEHPYLINTYHFTSEEAANSFLSDAKTLSDVGEFHHYDSFSLSPSNALELFVHTHSAINSAGVQKPGLTIRDVRYAILLDHLYHVAYAVGNGSGNEGQSNPVLDDDVVKMLVS